MDAKTDAKSSRYHEMYARWQRDPLGFWGEAAAEIDWIEKPKTVFDPKAGVYGRWFPDGVCNTCYNAVDRHVEAGRGTQAAIIYDSPVTGAKQTISYAALQTKTEILAGILDKDFGVKKGDRVILYMPMVPEAVVAMLACARIGAVHSVVFGGFAPKELATRIDDAKPKVILSASCGIEGARVIAYKPLLDEAINLAKHKPEACLILQRPQAKAELTPGRDHDWQTTWDEALVWAKNVLAPVPMLATDPLYILYTSGTTGVPKGVVRDNGGHMVALKWSMKNIYGVEPGEVWWAASDIGWVVGHSYIVYAPLLHGCTTILYEGKPVGTPDAGAFWRVIAEHGCVAMFTAPTAFRAIKKEDPQGKLSRAIRLQEIPHAVPGRRARRSRHHRLGGESPEGASHRPLVADRDRLVHRRQSGGPGPASGQARLAHRGDAGLRHPHRRRSWHEMPRGKMGSIVVKLPLPPSCLPTLWQADDRMRESYLAEFPGYYKTADAGYIDDDGYVYVMGRTDDIINVAGHQAFDRRHGGGAGLAPGRRRMRGARHQGRIEGRGAAAASSC